MLFQVLAYRVEILLHGLRVAVFYDDTEFFKTFADAFELVGGVGVEEDFAQQVVVLAHQSVGYGQMPFESGSRSILVLHDAAEYESGCERDRQRVGYRLVMLGESIFFDMEVEPLVDVAEEYLAEVVAFGDDDGAFVAQI